MFSLHFNLCNPAIKNWGVLVGKWKLFTRSREDIADIRNFHAGNYCITAVTFWISMQRKNLHELLLVLSSGHTVHWEKLLVTCETNLWSKMQPKCGPFGNCGPGRIHCLSHPRIRGFSGATTFLAPSHLLVAMEASNKPEDTWKLFNNGKICKSHTYHHLFQNGSTTDLLMACLPWLL